MIKKIIILTFLFVSVRSVSGDENKIFLKYKPAKLIRYESYFNSYGKDDWYNIKSCEYSIQETGKNLKVNVKFTKDSSSCLGGGLRFGWFNPHKYENNFIVDDHGELISSDEKKIKIYLFRFIPVPLPRKHFDSLFIPMIPKIPVIVSKEFLFSKEEVVNGKIILNEIKFICKNVTSDHIAEIQWTNSRNRDVVFEFNGLFDIDKGYWKYWEVYIKKKLYSKFRASEYFK